MKLTRCEAGHFERAYMIMCRDKKPYFLHTIYFSKLDAENDWRRYAGNIGSFPLVADYIVVPVEIRVAPKGSRKRG